MMSSILTKNIEMPKERESFTVTIKYNGLVFDTETGIQVAEAYEIPAADVREVKRGKWILKDDGRAHCSMCDMSGNSYIWNYCPNCGADMREEQT